MNWLVPKLSGPPPLEPLPYMEHPTSAYQRPAHFHGLLQFPVGCGTFPILTPPPPPVSPSHPLLFRFLSEHYVSLLWIMIIWKYLFLPLDLSILEGSNLVSIFPLPNSPGDLAFCLPYITPVVINAKSSQI